MPKFIQTPNRFFRLMIQKVATFIISNDTLRLSSPLSSRPVRRKFSTISRTRRRVTYKIIISLRLEEGILVTQAKSQWSWVLTAPDSYSRRGSYYGPINVITPNTGHRILYIVVVFNNWVTGVNCQWLNNNCNCFNGHVFLMFIGWLCDY